MIASFVKLDQGQYSVRFAYDPDAVDVVKRLPHFSRRWDPAAKMWIVDAAFIGEVVQGLKSFGYSIKGLETPKPGVSQANWADALFSRMGPDRVDPIFRALTRILHPDNPATGDGVIQQELNKARDKFR